MAGLLSAFTLPSPVQRLVDAASRDLLQPAGGPQADFTQPPGEAALVGPDSVSWRVFKNPVGLFIGGVAAVILELAEPGVRTGVWEHSSFRKDPVRRLQRTGLAAMVTIYGARSQAEAMIAGVVRRHDSVTGTIPGGTAYRANDVDLLTWVQATASFGFGQAYHRYVRPLARSERDGFYAEAAPAARLYGALNAPTSEAEWESLADAMRLRLEPSPIVFEFLALMRDAPVFPAPMRPFQHMMVRAAVEMQPGWVRQRLGLDASYGLKGWEAALVRQAGRLSDRIVLRASPAVLSCRRLGLPDDYLYRG